MDFVILEFKVNHDNTNVHSSLKKFKLNFSWSLDEVSGKISNANKIIAFLLNSYSNVWLNLKILTNFIIYKLNSNSKI